MGLPPEGRNIGLCYLTHCKSFVSHARKKAKLPLGTFSKKLDGGKIIRMCYQTANQSAISQYLLQQAGDSKCLPVLEGRLWKWQTHVSVCYFSCIAHQQDQLLAGVSWWSLDSARNHPCYGLSGQQESCATLATGARFLELHSHGLTVVFFVINYRLILKIFQRWTYHTRDLITPRKSKNGRLY